MRFFIVAALSVVVGIACQKSPTDENHFKSTKLSVNIEETESSLNLNGDIRAPLKFVSKADLWCNDKLKANLDFTADQQSIEIFSSIENCELRLTEFYFGGTYTLVGLFKPGVYEFELRDPASDRVIDKQLVRSTQVIGEGNEIQCTEACEFREVNVVFPHSVLDIQREILVNDVNFSELQVNMEEEPAPSCDSVEARFNQSDNPLTLPSLEIKLLNCVNTIGTGDLEFAFGPTSLDENGQLPAGINILDLFNVINDFPFVPTREGDDYTISFTFDELKEFLTQFSDFDTLQILTFDYVVAMRNKDGISGLVYLFENECEAPPITGL
ncbi:MAG: hypothetical protein ACOH5I_09095 [Oligoflexus sp.]